MNHWWYFSYTSMTNPHLSGCQMLCMGEEFDFLAVHKWIEQHIGGPGIIVFYTQVSVQQVRQYSAYTRDVERRANAEKLRKLGKAKLDVLPGGKSDEEPIA